jgi:DNA-binding HxlR family transcriptional regulator
VSGTGVSLVRRTKTSEARRLARGERELVAQIEEVLEVLQGKWKAHLVFLMARGVHRHCRLLECLPGTSKKMMTDTLRALERDGLVRRWIFAEVPLRVEYSLTPLGWAITEPLMALAEWQAAHGRDVEEARRRYRFGDGAEIAHLDARTRQAGAGASPRKVGSR